jgi:hypothetical protein
MNRVIFTLARRPGQKGIEITVGDECQFSLVILVA